jgi:quercetin dioxygenase-like cupin family protein
MEVRVMASASPATAADFAEFDLSREIADCANRKPWQSGHFAKTLFKNSDFRVVLISMERAARLKEHHADGTISIHVLQGAIRLNAQGKTHDLRSSSLFTLAPSIKHDLEALEDSAVLLTISWPPSDKLRSLEHRGYGA